MKTTKYYLLVLLLGTSFAFQSCARNRDDVWDDTKSAGRHMSRGIRALGGKHGSSRQVRNRNDFECIEDNCCYEDPCFQEAQYSSQDRNSAPDCEYVPLDDLLNDNELAMADMVSSQPRETPGEYGSSIPGIQAFRDPHTIPQLAGLFKNIYFEYNSSLVKGQENLQTVHAIANFLRSHPNMYLFIEGHTDERGPQAYNLALGSRRSNTVRNLLINEGVNPDNLFTISYGKEKPLVMEQHEEGWSKNRRAEFKIYER